MSFNQFRVPPSVREIDGRRLIGLPLSFFQTSINCRVIATQSIFIDSDLLYVRETVKTTSGESIDGHSPN